MRKRENEREGEGFWGELGEREGAAGPMGPKGARAGAAGPARGGPRRGREKKEEREKEKEKERKGFSPFRNPIFLDECTYISKQSKKCIVRHGASNNIK